MHIIKIATDHEVTVSDEAMTLLRVSMSVMNISENAVAMIVNGNQLRGIYSDLVELVANVEGRNLVWGPWGRDGAKCWFLT